MGCGVETLYKHHGVSHNCSAWHVAIAHRVALPIKMKRELLGTKGGEGERGGNPFKLLIVF